MQSSLIFPTEQLLDRPVKLVSPSEIMMVGTGSRVLKTTESHVLVFFPHTVPEVEFKEPQYEVSEGDGTVEVCVQLNTDIEEPLTIEVEAIQKPDAPNPAGLITMQAMYTAC